MSDTNEGAERDYITGLYAPAAAVFQAAQRDIDFELVTRDPRPDEFGIAAAKAKRDSNRPTPAGDAARARQAGMNDRAAGGRTGQGDRPSHRRNYDEGGSANRTPAIRLQQLELRDTGADTPVTGFTGYASVTSQGYQMWDEFGPYTEVVACGAFEATLALEGLDVPLVLQHDSLRRIARTTNGTLRLSEDDTGLLVDADLDPADSDVAYITPKMRAGLIDEMSFMFHITEGQWSDDWTEFHINAVDINRGDVAIVGYGASPLTSAALRAAPHTPARAVITDDDVRVRVLR
jgi:HK97 family phage prohead protease